MVGNKTMNEGTNERTNQGGKGGHTRRRFQKRHAHCVLFPPPAAAATCAIVRTLFFFRDIQFFSARTNKQMTTTPVAIANNNELPFFIEKMTRHNIMVRHLIFSSFPDC